MQIVISGIGGQGVIFATRLIVEASFIEGKRAISSEIHGMSQRGGSLLSQIKIGGYLSGQIRKGSADYIACFTKSEMQNCLDYLKFNGAIFLNDTADSPINLEFLKFFKANKIHLHKIDAGKIAKQLSLMRMTNLILLGFSSYYWRKILSKDSFLLAIERISSKKTVDQNIKAFLAGYENGD